MHPDMNTFKPDDKTAACDAEAVEQPGVLRTLNLLEQEVDRTVEIINVLASHLAPVLRPTDQVASAYVTLTSEHDSDLAQGIGHAVDRLSTLRQRLAELNDRVDV